jgi:long-chain acyl-CoA synthetase
VLRADSLPRLLEESAEAYGNAVAVAQTRHSGGETLTYAELLQAARRGAATLVAHGFNRGDRVLLVAAAGPEWVAALFAILGAGLTAVPAPAETPATALASMAAHVGAVAAVFDPRTRECVQGLPGVVAVSIESLQEAGEVPVSFQEPAQVALLAFTSGSTRQPRAVELTHANLLGDLEALLAVRRAGPGDVFLSMLPPAHLFELMGGLLGPLASGARVVYGGTPLPNRIVKALREEEVTHAMAVPGVLHALYAEVMEELADDDVVATATRTPQEAAQHIRDGLGGELLWPVQAGLRERIGQAFRCLVVGGAALDPVWGRILPPLGIRLECGYGLTEAGPIVSVGYVSECPPGSVGRPLPGVDVRVDDEGGILVRGPNVMRGYHGDVEATAKTLVDGWLRTGDRGRLSDDGFLFVSGRQKEAMVTSAGETIYPDEVEPFYEGLPVEEYCVAPLPGPDGNDVPALIVVPRGRQENSELEPAYRVLRAAAPPRYRVERLIPVVGPLPRTASGKVRRRWLAQALVDQAPDSGGESTGGGKA